jgi:hypothetical protein
VSYFINGHYSASINISWKLILQGKDYIISSYIIGYCYEYGLELNKNIEKALQFYLLSALCGFTLSQLRLANIYYLDKNYKMAYFYYAMYCKNPDAYFYKKCYILYILTRIRIIYGLSVYQTNITVVKQKEKIIEENIDLDRFILK